MCVLTLLGFIELLGSVGLEAYGFHQISTFFGHHIFKYFSGPQFSMREMGIMIGSIL